MPSGRVTQDVVVDDFADGVGDGGRGQLIDGGYVQVKRRRVGAKIVVGSRARPAALAVGRAAGAWRRRAGAVAGLTVGCAGAGQARVG